MLRRLLERLEEAVEGLFRQHVHFVDDVHLGAGGDGAVAGVLDDLAHIVDAGVGGRVHLDHVDMARVHDRLAVDAELRHVDARAVDLSGHGIVEGAGEDARRRRLAGAAHAGEDVGLMDAVGGEGIGEGADHRLLADQVLEPLRAVFARQHPIGRLRGRSARRLGRKQGVAHRPSLALRIDGDGGALQPARRFRRPCSEGGRLDKDPPCLVRAASFRT